MNNEFEEVMSKRTDAELLAVLKSSPDDYQPLALDAAKTELKKRNLSNEQIQSAESVIKHKQDLEEAKLNEPLSTTGKVLAFIFPNVISTLLWRTYQTNRKYKEKLRWNICGICLYAAIFLYFLVSYYFSK